MAKLVLPHEKSVSRAPLFQFLVYGVPHAFPAVLGPDAPGIPTAFSAPPLNREFRTNDAVVWPSIDGSIRGQSLTPLYPGAARTPVGNPPLYELLALTDALRMGQIRERQSAQEHMRLRLGLSGAVRKGAPTVY